MNQKTTTESDTSRKFCFASDNYAGICPEAWEALEQARHGFARAYGDDPWTESASNAIREVFDTDCEVFFVFNGTAANSLAVASLCQSFHSVLCHEAAHIETDECGAPEFFTHGTKVLLIPGNNGRLDPRGIERLVYKRDDIHYPKPRVVSITQATELGTVYQRSHIQEIGHICKSLGLRLHMDGARFANAMATLNCAPSEITWKAGVDVLCLGGTKNGMPIGDAVVFFNRELAQEFDYRCKQAGQLASKMRFLAAPWVGLLRDQAWLKHGAHANLMAEYLESKLRKIPGVRILFPREANSVFLELAPAVAQELRTLGWAFYSFIGQGGCRFMCSWETRKEDVDALVQDVQRLSVSALATPQLQSA